MKVTIFTTEALEFRILQILYQNYSNSNEILEKLKEEQLAFDNKIFYPALSRLSLKNFLCTNWLKIKNEVKEKYYFLTPLGKIYFEKLQLVGNVNF